LLFSSSSILAFWPCQIMWTSSSICRTFSSSAFPAVWTTRIDSSAPVFHVVVAFYVATMFVTNAA
jgi:hypothetical protein